MGEEKKGNLGSVCSLPEFLTNLPVSFLHGLLLPSVVYCAANGWALWDLVYEWLCSLWYSGISALLIPLPTFSFTKMGWLCSPAIHLTSIPCLWISPFSNVYLYFNGVYGGNRDVSSTVFNWLSLEEFSVLSLGESFCNALPVCQF